MPELDARAIRLSSRIIGTPIANAIIFFSVVVCGCLYIIDAKLHGVSAFFVTFGPVVIMVAYALLILLARPLRLRDDQSGDNLYYMGFLFTLTSLAVSLYQFNADGAAELIVQNFGVAIASTITGIALRILFNQMRQDPVEVESHARMELADAARRVRRELDNTVLELAGFRRAAQQAIMDGFDETKEKVDQVGERLLSGLETVTQRSAEPLEAASKQSGMTLEELTRSVVSSLEAAAQHLSGETERLSHSTASVTGVLEALSQRLNAMSTPDQVIEIKLDPAIERLSQVVTAFSANTEAQTASATALQKELATRDALMWQAIEAAQAAAKAATDTALLLQTRTTAYDGAASKEPIAAPTEKQEPSRPLFKGPWSRPKND